ncbi:amidohydrolase [Demequina aurantiaca]|uniref:amidohydrolase n=1 Tax=Demequina aurantiaca TaxID=676200 RepID=UPI0007845EEA|nr:amidohydrolase family protein [Demequina aurantiaca]
MRPERFDTVLRHARITGGADSTVDVLIRDGRIAQIAPEIEADDAAGAEQVDLDGRFLGPGMWDNHVHFALWARTRRRFHVAGASSAAEVCAMVAARVAAEPENDATLVGVGFRDALWPDVPTTEALDAASRHRPVVLISGDVHCCWVNSAAERHYDLAHAGLLRETEAFELQRKLEVEPDDDERIYAVEAGASAAARGTVGIVDLEMADNMRLWVRNCAQGLGLLRVRAGFYEDMFDTMVERGVRTGDIVEDTNGLVTVGPFKIITDGSLNTKTAYCHDPYPGTADHGIITVPPTALEDMLDRATQHGFEVAVHAIGDLANTFALDAFASTGARGSIEHAQLVQPEDIGRFAQLGITASVQPEHAMDDRDAADVLWAGRTDRSFPLADLHAAGARIALGSDAPVATLDPWISFAAAVSRSRDGREAWHPEQQLSREAALAASTCAARVEEGALADLVVTDADPMTAEPEVLRRMPVAATLVGGAFTHTRL